MSNIYITLELHDLVSHYIDSWANDDISDIELEKMFKKLGDRFDYKINMMGDLKVPLEFFTND